MRITRRFALVTAIILSAAIPAKASTILPDASSDIILTVDSVVTSQNLVQWTSNTSFQSPSSGTPAAIGTAQIAPEPTFTATSSLVAGVSQAITYDTFSYWFEITSSRTTQAHLIFSANGYVSPSATTANQALLQVNDTHGNLLVSAAACSAANNGCGNVSSQSSFSIAAPISIGTNTLYDVQGSVYAIAQTGFNASSQSSIDPFITFDPNFDSTGLTLEFSPNIGNTPAAPEPSTWAMMLLGFAGLGFLAYRRRNQVSLVA